MVTPLNPAEEPEEVEVDIDLDEMDEALRKEALGESTTVKIDGQIIHILHAGDWSSGAMRAATQGDWNTWAQEVIEDPEEFETWSDSNLKNYQVEAIFTECGRQARLTVGKPEGSL